MTLTGYFGVFSILMMMLIFSGCSYRGLYEGIQTGNRNECATVPPSQYDECIENNSKSYDGYEQKRKEAQGNK